MTEPHQLTSPRERMFAAGVRIDEVIWLPGATLAEDGANDGLSLLVQRFPDRASAPLFGPLAELLPFIGRELADDDAAAEEIANVLAHRPGFIVNAVAAWRYYLDWNRPVQSWGQTWGAWLYAPSEAQIADVAIAWADDRHAANYMLSKEKRGWRGPGD